MQVGIGPLGIQYGQCNQFLDYKNNIKPFIPKFQTVRYIRLNLPNLYQQVIVKYFFAVHIFEIVDVMFLSKVA